MKVLVTGAKGVVQRRLVGRLLDAGHTVRVVVADAAESRGQPWAEAVEVAVGELTDESVAHRALEGITTAYYVVKDVGEPQELEGACPLQGDGAVAELDRQMADLFGRAAAAQGVAKVIYLGYLQPAGEHAPPFVRVRAEIGQLLQEQVPTTELRAGPFVAAGSQPFEALRSYTERMPWIFAPHWIDHELQPIWIEDMVAYLLAALDLPPAGVVQVGGERLTPRQMIATYAAERGLHRRVFALPCVCRWLTSWWLSWWTPLDRREAAYLVDTCRYPITAHTSRAQELFPDLHPKRFRPALREELRGVEQGQPDTTWLEPGTALARREADGLYQEHRTVRVALPPEAAYRVLSGLEGADEHQVWHQATMLRRLIDQLVGGPRARGDLPPIGNLFLGQGVRSWHVEHTEPPRRLRLRAETHGGKAWWDWRLRPEGDGTEVTQTLLYAPQGAYGALIWPLRRGAYQDIAEAMAAALEQGGAPAPEAPDGQDGEANAER